jgi:glycosyltransferase involved in cell wall biosynthesis
MRICIVYQGEIPPAERIEKTVRTLVAAGHEMYVLCNNYGPVPVEDECAPAVRIIRIGPTFGSRKVNKIVKFPAFVNPVWVAHIYAAVRRFHIEALHVIDVPLSPAVLALGRRFNIPVVYDMWENYPEALKGWAKDSWTTRWFKNPWVAAVVEKFVIRRVDHVFTVVEEARDRVIALGASPERVSIVTNGIDLDMFCARPVRSDTPVHMDDSAYKLLFVGAVTVERGLEDIIRALPLVQREIPSARLFIGGFGPDEPRLQRITAQAAVTADVRFLGWVKFEDIQSYVAGSDLCLVPHVANEFINTTMPNKLFQYMALGKPVLVSDAKPLARTVRECECGYIYRSGDPHDAARTIVEAYNRRMDTTIGVRGREAVERYFTWDAAARDMVRVYEQLSERCSRDGSMLSRRAAT